jgi:hypothetical protein
MQLTIKSEISYINCGTQKSVLQFILLCNRALDQLNDFHHRNFQESKTHSDAVFQKADGDKAKGICSKGHFDDQRGQLQAIQHSCPQNFVVAVERKYALSLGTKVKGVEYLTHTLSRECHRHNVTGLTNFSQCAEPAFAKLHGCTNKVRNNGNYRYQNTLTNHIHPQTAGGNDIALFSAIISAIFASVIGLTSPFSK